MLFVSKEGAAITVPKAAFSLVNATEKAAIIATAFRKVLLCFITISLIFCIYNVCITNLYPYLPTDFHLIFKYILFPEFVTAHYCKIYTIMAKIRALRINDSFCRIVRKAALYFSFCAKYSSIPASAAHIQEACGPVSLPRPTSAKAGRRPFSPTPPHQSGRM